MLYVIAHGLVKSSLFICCGALKQRFDAIDESELHGRARGWHMLLSIYVLGAIGLAAAPFFVTARSDSLLHAAVRNHGFTWVLWVFSLSGIITAGAVLRSAGAVFFGWGPVDGKSSKESGGEREAASEGRAVEEVMLFPAALLVALAICLTFAPGLDRITLAGAKTFHDGASIRSRILYNAEIPAAPIDPTRMSKLQEESVWDRYSIGTGCLNVAFAFFVAALALNRNALRLNNIRFLHGSVKALRKIHSGVVGDYAAWLTAGFAIFSGLILLLSHP
jgi:multicomponent Na+:H+ antiporter subunit D